MTTIEKPCRRLTRGALDGSHGPDRGRKLVASFVPGDLVEIRPQGTRRAEVISLFDIYRLSLRMRANAEHLQKARAKKERKALRLAAQRQIRAEKRLFKN